MKLKSYETNLGETQNQNTYKTKEIFFDIFISEPFSTTRIAFYIQFMLVIFFIAGDMFADHACFTIMCTC